MQKKTNKTKPFLCIELLNTFSEKEITGLEQLISCPYFNTDRYVIKLLPALKKWVLSKSVFTTDLQCRVYKQVFAHLPTPTHQLKKKQSSLLNMKMNSLMRLAEEFLSIETMKENKGFKQDLLYPQLLERRQFWSFNRHIKKAKKQFEEQQAKGEKQYAAQYRTEQNIMDALYSNGKLIEEDNLPELVQNLDIYYLLNRLSLHLTALSIQEVSLEKTFYMSSINTLEALLNIPTYKSHPIIILYQANIRLLETKSTTAYTDLLALLNKHSASIPRDMLKDFYTICISHCVNQVKKGKLQYNQNVFELYKIMHDKNLLINDNFISIAMLKNMIIIACRQNEFLWAEQLIKDYRPFIQKSVRESVYQFNMGILAFYQKNYELAHSRFILVEKINTAYDINVRIIILKCLYEKEKAYSEPIMQSFRTAEKYFKNHKSLSAKGKKEFQNFIRIFINLYRIRHQASKMTIKRLREKLEQQQANSDKRWLLEKIDELEGGFRAFY